jgi:ParB family transcriptional regulator, chromosome partitioning protein
MTTSNTAADKVHEKRRALGRGLESLLPGPRAVTRPAAEVDASTSVPTSPAPETLDVVQAMASPAAADGQTVTQLAVDLIDHNPYQTRKQFNEAAMAEMAESVAVQGVLQPIVVRPGAGGRFILILGERRLRASKLAGKDTIPAIVRRVSDQHAAEMTVVENLQRQDLNCMEQAAAFQRMSRNFNMTQEQIGKRVGYSREQVSNYIRLLSLPYDIYEALEKGQLSYTHARLLLSLGLDTEISRVGQLAMRQKMSVSALEDLVRRIHHPGGEDEAPKLSGGARWVDPNVRAAQRSLEAVLGMKVRIRDRSGKGKITIEYGKLEDFDRVVGMLKGK